MTVLFAGSEADAFTVRGAPTWETTSGGTFYDDTYTDGVLSLFTGDELEATFTAQTDVWIHFSLYWNTINDNNIPSMFRAWGSNGEPLLRIGDTDDVQQQDFDRYDGAAYQSIDDAILSDGVLNDIDIHIVIDGTVGTFELYEAGVLVSSYVGDTTVAATDVAKITFTGGKSTYARQPNITQVIVDTTSTLGYKLDTLRPTANSATHIDWTGDYTDIDDLGVLDSNTLTSATADEVEAFTKPAVQSPSNYIYKALVQSAPISIGAEGPQNCQFVTRSNGTDYFSSNISGLTPGALIFQNIEETDPDTGVAWTQAGLDAAEIGVKSIT